MGPNIAMQRHQDSLGNTAVRDAQKADWFEQYIVTGIFVQQTYEYRGLNANYPLHLL